MKKRFHVRIIVAVVVSGVIAIVPSAWDASKATTVTDAELAALWGTQDASYWCWSSLCNSSSTPPECDESIQCGGLGWLCQRDTWSAFPETCNPDMGNEYCDVDSRTLTCVWCAHSFRCYCTQQSGSLTCDDFVWEVETDPNNPVVDCMWLNTDRLTCYYEECNKCQHLPET